MTIDPRLPFSRRQWLSRMGTGFGTLGLASVLAADGLLGASPSEASAVSPLAARPAHFAARAKRVIFLFMNGGPSHVDTFDPKPDLEKYAGQTPEELVKNYPRAKGKLFPSPFKFQKYGENGVDVSELYPHVAGVIDDICVIRSMHTEIPNHEPGLLMMNSGNTQPTRPSLGSWLTYGLGTENQNLPGYVVLCPGKPVVGPQLGKQFSAWHLPRLPYQQQQARSEVGDCSRTEFVSAARGTTTTARFDSGTQSNTRRASRPGQSVGSPHRVARDGLPSPVRCAGSFDLEQEPQSMRDLYGRGEFADACLLSRRLVERGVRMVQVYYGNGQPWDDHGDIMNHAKHAKASDQAIAGLISDLKQRGLLDETLIVWTGEFGRTPWSQGAKGRDHHSRGFTSWWPEVESKVAWPMERLTSSVTPPSRNLFTFMIYTPPSCT